MLYIQKYSRKTRAIGLVLTRFIDAEIGFQSNRSSLLMFPMTGGESDTKRNHRGNQQHLKAFRTVNEQQRLERNDKFELSAPGPGSWVTDGFWRTRRQPAFKIWARTSEPGVVNMTWFKMCALVQVSLQ